MNSVPISQGVQDTLPEVTLPDLATTDATDESEDNLQSILNTGIEDTEETLESPNDAECSEEIDLPNNDFCFTHEDFLENTLWNNNASRTAQRHAGAYNSAWREIKALVGQTVESKSSKGNALWTIVEDVEDDCFFDRRMAEMKLFREKFSPATNEDRVFHDSDDLSKAFWKLWPVDVDDEVEKLNKLIDETNRENKETYRRQYKHASKSEFLTFHALLIAASLFSEKGEKLWEDEKPKRRRGISKSVNFGKWMKAWRFRQLKLFIPRLMECKELEGENDDWWKFKKRVHDFNTNRKNNIYASHALVFDESMSAYVPR